MRASSRALALYCTIAVGCIPSHRLVHEGDTYFERCYGADFDERIRQERKEQCWQAWITHYTKHQPAHRVDYALSRIEALQAGEPTPTLPGLVEGALPAPELASELAAADAAASNTSASLLGPSDADGGSVPHGCLQVCDAFEQRCLTRCPGAGIACRDTCQRERATCLNGCY